MSRSDSDRALKRHRASFAWFRGKLTRRARRAAKVALAVGREPEPYRHRHGADWFD